MKGIIFLIVILIFSIRIVGYGIYTIRDNNKTGGVGLFVLAFINMLASIYFFIK